MPTGEEETEPALETNLRFGAGAMSLLAAVEASAGTKSGALSSYGRAEIRVPLGEGESGVRYGRTSTAALGIDVPLGARGGFLAQAIGQRQGVDELDGVAMENRGGSFAYLAAGGRIGPAKGWQGSLLVERLVHADVHGNQLVAPWSLLLALSRSAP